MYFRSKVTVEVVAQAIVRPHPHRAGALSDDARLTSGLCLSRTSGLSREQRGLERLKLVQR